MSSDINTNQPVVIDNGSGVLKAGYAGEEFPKCIQSMVGEPKHDKIMAGARQEDFFIGPVAEELRGILRIRYPMEHGIVENWSDMERIWNYMFTKELKIIPEEHPVLLTEAPLNPRKNREKMAEIFFETFNVPALFVSTQAVLSLYASGRTTGVVLDSGDGVTHAVPVFEGFAIPHAITRIDVAGRDITNNLQLLLRKGGYRFHTSAEKEVIRSIKEECCYVTFNPQKEEEMENKGEIELYDYKLPDGQIIKIGPERFRAPEILFQPSLIGLEYEGIHESLVNCIKKTDLDIRKTLYSKIVLAGGSTLFRGFGDRLIHEVRKLTPKDVKIKIAAPPDRKFSTWLGGSILASLATFKKMWVSSAEYTEEGASVVHRKTF